MIGLNDKIVSSRKVRNGLYAYRLQNGGVSIGKQLYIFYSLTEAISKYRRDYPKYKNKR
jgi:hypothetical protein